MNHSRPPRIITDRLGGVKHFAHFPQVAIVFHDESLALETLDFEVFHDESLALSTLNHSRPI